MPHVNIEIKARCDDPAAVRTTLLRMGARMLGPDRQIDTYFRVPHGRLKLREGLIENNLIFYAREDTQGPKRSDVILYGTRPSSDLKALLTAALGTLVAVEKRREIYFVAVAGLGLDGIENVKIHLDSVDGLGSFVEIEAIDLDGTIGPERLRAQCEYLIDRLGIRAADLLADSYSDLILARLPPDR